MVTQPITLSFCVGATKASTTWLYSYLAQHPDCHLRSIKELHFFDTLESGGGVARANRMQRDLDHARAQQSGRPTGLGGASIADTEAVIAMLRSGDEAQYLAYLNGGRGAERLIADATPAYALLPVARLQRMAALLPDVRFVYLIRDPVARLWSHVRMLAHREGGDIATRTARIYDDVLAGGRADVTDRGDYASVLTRLDAAIDPSRLLVMFQEVLLTEPGVTKLCAFLGIAQKSADFARVLHRGPEMAMSVDQQRRARVALRRQYDCVATRFGTVPDAWMRNMNEGVA